MSAELQKTHNSAVLIHDNRNGFLQQEKAAGKEQEDESMSLDQVSPAAAGGVSEETQRYLPEPATTKTGAFSDFMDVAGAVGSAAMAGVGGLMGGSAGGLIGAQLEAQREMMMITMISNIERSKHETKMSAVRNMRVA